MNDLDTFQLFYRLLKGVNDIFFDNQNPKEETNFKIYVNEKNIRHSIVASFNHLSFFSLQQILWPRCAELSKMMSKTLWQCTWNFRFLIRFRKKLISIIQWFSWSKLSLRFSNVLWRRVWRWVTFLLTGSIRCCRLLEDSMMLFNLASNSAATWEYCSRSDERKSIWKTDKFIKMLSFQA